METRANYVLIGAFTLAGILGALGFFLWLAKIEVDRQYAYYDTLFEDVTGLGRAGDVRYNGLLVGRVVDLELDRDDPSRVRIRMELDGDVPVKTDTVAVLEYQGVTGVTFVALRGGSPEAPLLRVASDRAVPVIPSEKSAFQSLFEGGPELIQKAIDLLEDVNTVVSPENRQAVTAVLANLESATAELDNVLKDVSGLSDDLSGAAEDLAGFTGVLGDVADTAETTLKTADETLRTATAAIQRAEATIDNATGALGQAEETFATVNRLASERLPGLLDTVDRIAGAAEGLIADLGSGTGEMTERLEAIAGRVSGALDQAEAVLAGVDDALTQASATMKAIETVSGSVDTLVAGEGAALVGDLRTTLASAEGAIGNATGALAEAEKTFATANTVLTEQVPGLIERVDGAVASVDRVVTDVGGKAGQVVDNLDRVSEALVARLTEAETTFAAVESTLTQANSTLRSIEQTSTAVGTLVATDGEALVADARQTMAAARSAITSAGTAIEQDLPAVLADVRAATASVNALVAEAGDDVVAFTGQLEGLGALAGTTMSTATATLSNANTTLTALSAAAESADGALAAAEQTFTGVNRIIEEDLDAIVADIRTATSKLDEALGAATADLPEITGQIRQTMATTTAFVETLNTTVAANSGQLEEFMKGGLPAFVRFVQEARKLVSNLERLTAKIERDPARFLLGTQAPEFRR